MAGENERGPAPDQGAHDQGAQDQAWRPPAVEAEPGDPGWGGGDDQTGDAPGQDQPGEPELPTQGESAQQAARESSPQDAAALALDVPPEGGSPVADDYDAGVGTPEPPD